MSFLTVTQSLAAAARKPWAFASLATSLVLLALAGGRWGGVEAEDPLITAEGSAWRRNGASVPQERVVFGSGNTT